MEKLTFQFVLLILLWVIVIGLCLFWFDWKFLVIMLLFGWAMNLQNKRKSGN